MKFLNYSSTSSLDEIKACWNSYSEYLDRIDHLLPPKTRQFARAEWRLDWSDPRAPHDAWLEEFKIGETSETPGSSKRDIFIEARFLGAHHDGVFTLSYQDVRKYSLEKEPLFEGKLGNGHGDWLLDEVRYDNDDLVVHEIVFSNNARWTISCKDIEYNWIPAPKIGHSN